MTGGRRGAGPESKKESERTDVRSEETQHPRKTATKFGIIVSRKMIDHGFRRDDGERTLGSGASLTLAPRLANKLTN